MGGGMGEGVPVSLDDRNRMTKREKLLESISNDPKTK